MFEKKPKTADLVTYEDKFSETGFWAKLRNHAKSIGINLVYQVLLLYYVLRSDNCPAKLKLTLTGVLGYFLSPIDFIPDMTPIIGYTDDIYAVSIAFAMAQFYITEEMRSSAKEMICDLFGEETLERLADVNVRETAFNIAANF